jgi:formate-dependent nitrite reductase membrane component NrfD
MEDIILQTNWTWEIAIYLFLGGLAAGTLFVSAIINLATKDRFKKTIRFGAWSGTILLALGILFLLADVGIPGRAILLYQSFVNSDSWMAFGAWFLFAGVIIFGLYALCNTEWVTDKLKFLLRWRMALAVIIIPLSLGIAIYTGILLGVLYAHPLWNTWLLPALFTVSALDTGVAFITGYAVLCESKMKEGLNHLKKSLEISTVILVVLEGIVLTTYLTTIASSGDVANTSVQLLTMGLLSPLFWYIFVGLGLCIPFLASMGLVIRHDLAEKTWDVLPMVGVASCLVGGFTLRFIILVAGLSIYV